MIKKSLLGLLTIIVLFPLLSCGGLTIELAIANVKGNEVRGLLPRIKNGMNTEEVEGVLGREPGWFVRYGVPEGADEQFSHNWWVNDYRLEVVYQGSRVSNIHTYGPSAGLVGRFVGAVFFWWIPDD